MILSSLVVSCPQLSEAEPALASLDCACDLFQATARNRTQIRQSLVRTSVCFLRFEILTCCLPSSKSYWTSGKRRIKHGRNVERRLHRLRVFVSGRASPTRITILLLRRGIAYPRANLKGLDLCRWLDRLLRAGWFDELLTLGKILSILITLILGSRLHIKGKVP
jgi:hypothetical protein